MKYAYVKTNGMAHDLRFVADGYVAAPNETVIGGNALPDINTLHDPSYLAAEAQAVLVAQAKAALAETDETFIRCGKAGVPWPASWQTYVLALRAIVDNPASASALPTMPSYPAGS